MGNLGGGEILVILLVALIVLGPTRLPEAARQIGKAATELRRISGGFQRELREAITDPIEETKAMMKGQVTPGRPTRPAEPAGSGGSDDDGRGARSEADAVSAPEPGRQPATAAEPVTDPEPDAGPSAESRADPATER